MTWVFDRETITAGLDAFTGEGAMKVRPRSDCGERICIALMSHEGTAILEGPKDDFQEFLYRTNDH